MVFFYGNSRLQCDLRMLNLYTTALYQMMVTYEASELDISTPYFFLLFFILSLEAYESLANFIKVIHSNLIDTGKSSALQKPLIS